MADFGSDLYSLFFGRPGQFQQASSSFTPQQQQVLNSLLQQGQQGLGTDAIEGRARRGFQQSTIPLLSERFANVGGRGLSGIGSSGYNNALIDEGTKLESELAAQRQGNALDLLKLGLTPQTNQYFEEGTPGIAGDLTNLAARAGLAYATGGTSEAGNIMQLFQSLFGGGMGQGSSNANIDIQGGPQNPLQNRLSQQSGTSLFQGQQARNIGAPISTTRRAAMNQLQQGGFGNIQNLLNQSLFSGLGANYLQGL